MNAASAGARVARFRAEAGLSQRALAVALHRSPGWVSRVERGILPLTDLRVLAEVAGALGRTVADLLGEAAPAGGHLSDDELQRRAFLAGLGVLAVGALGADLVTRLSAALDRPARTDTATVDALTAATAELGRLYGTLSASGLHGLARGHLDHLTRLAAGAPAAHRPRLCSLAAETAGVCAWISADLARENDALALLDTGLRAAAAAGDAAIAAYLLATATVLDTFRRRAPADVVEVLTGTTRGICMASASPATAAWADTLRATAHARLGDRDGALHALADAHEHLARPEADGERRPRRPFFDRARLAGEHGVLALRLGGIRPHETRTRLQAALDGIPPGAKIGARYSTALAVLAAGQDDIDTAQACAHRSLDLAADVERSLAQVRALHAGPLTPWVGHPAVERLDRRLAELTT